MEVSATTPESHTRPSSSVEWLPSSYSYSPSPSPPPRCLRISPWPWRNDRPLNYLHRLIAADCNCRELFRLGWNCSLKGMEKWGKKTSVDHINYTLPMWSCSPILKTAAMEAQLYSLMMQSREWHQANLHCSNRATCSKVNLQRVSPLETLSKDMGDLAWSSTPPGWYDRSWLFSWPGWREESGADSLPPSLLL